MSELDEDRGDVLSAVLRSMQVRGSVYFCAALEGAWVKDYPATPRANFHHLREGGGWLCVDGRVESVGPGDIVFLAPGVTHRLCARHPENGAALSERCVLLCGHARLRPSDNPLARELFPRWAALRDAPLREHRWLRESIEQLGGEFLGERPGAQLVIDKLCEIVLVEMVRANFGQPVQSALLRAHADRIVAATLRHLHGEPARPWTLAVLAAAVGSSRAVVARRFKAAVGEPMFAYLSRLRVERARELLADRALALGEVAERVGYRSELAFAKTFRKATGQTPSGYRRALRSADGGDQ